MRCEAPERQPSVFCVQHWRRMFGRLRQTMMRDTAIDWGVLPRQMHPAPSHLPWLGWLPLLGLGDGQSSASSRQTARRAKVAWRWRDMLVHRESPLTKLLSTYLTWQSIMCCVLWNFLGFFLTRYVSKCGCFPQCVTLCLGLPDHLCMRFHLSWCLHQCLHAS